MGRKDVNELVENYTLVHEMDENEVRADEAVLTDLCKLASIQDWELRASIAELSTLVVETEVEHNGVPFTTEVVNPVWRASLRLSQRQRTLRPELGIEWGGSPSA